MPKVGKAKKKPVAERTKEQQEADKLVDLACASIEQAHGKGAVMLLGANKAVIKNVDVIPTGSLSLDLALGIGGLPRGATVEVYGNESAGKTTVALHAIAQAQKKGGNCAFIDAEHALDPDYAQVLGVNTDKLLLAQPDCGEQALEILDTFVQAGGMSCVVVDSVAALTPRAELEGEMGDAHMGLQARLMSQAMRKLVSSTKKSGTCVIFINQTRQKIGVMWGSPTTTTGGNALKFYASVRLEIARIGAIKKGDDAIGNKTRVKVVKNKLAPPFKKVEFDIIYGEGISYEGDVLDLAVTKGIVDKSGTWFSYGTQRIGQGRENTRLFLTENPKITKEIREKILGAK
jgi:recombination protein RecA